jgi:hypothetical protein
MSNLETFITAYNEAKKTMEKAVKRDFATLFTNFFDKYPQADKIMFTAYAPYFNDGEPCVFNAHLDYAQLFFTQECYPETENMDEDEFDDYVREMFSNEEGAMIYSQAAGWPSAEMKNDFGDLVDLLQTIPEEALETSFGEGLYIVTRNGVYIDEYSHD